MYVLTDDARNVTQAGQNDADEEVDRAATLEEDTQRWQDDGEDDLDDVAAIIMSAMRPDDAVAGMLELALHLRSGERHGCGLANVQRLLWLLVFLVVDSIEVRRRVDEQSFSVVKS